MSSGTQLTLVGWTIVLLFISLAVAAAQAPEPLSVRLQKAIFAEEIEGSLEAAIQSC